MKRPAISTCLAIIATLAAPSLAAAQKAPPSQTRLTVIERATAPVVRPLNRNAVEPSVESMVARAGILAAEDAQNDMRAIMAALQSLKSEPPTSRATIVGPLKPSLRGMRQSPRATPIAEPCQSNAKASLLTCLDRLHGKVTSLPVSADREALLADLADVKADIDSMNEMGELESLRLQMAMDRMTKMMSTLSNLLEKTSDTADTITQNMK